MLKLVTNAARPAAIRKRFLTICCLLGGPLFLSTPLSAQESKAAGQYVDPEHDDRSEVGAKLSNPVSNVWALFTEFDLSFSNGDLNQGDAKPGSRMLFQPVLPIPLFGEGQDQWKLITRPTVPILFSQPVPDGSDKFN